MKDSRAKVHVQFDTDRLVSKMDEFGYRCDMRAVIIVEFWAMMAGGLPFGWRVCESRHYGGFVYASGPGWESVPSRQTCADMWWGDVWAMEYAERPRLEE